MKYFKTGKSIIKPCEKKKIPVKIAVKKIPVKQLKNLIKHEFTKKLTASQILPLDVYEFMQQSYFQAPQRPIIETGNATISNNMADWGKIQASYMEIALYLIDQ